MLKAILVCVGHEDTIYHCSQNSLSTTAAKSETSFFFCYGKRKLRNAVKSAALI